MLFGKKRKRDSVAEPIIERIKEYVPLNWDGSGLIFRLENGKGLLRQVYGAAGENGLHSLLFGDIPLIRFHGDEYMCPTCQKLISAGYGLEEADSGVVDALRAALNGPFVSLDQSLKDLAPLLGLLSSGFYALADIALYPTDGDGHFFWTQTNTPRYNQASCPIYEDGNWAQEYPAFVLPSQPPTHYNAARADYYRDKPECRAVAFNMGFLNVLLDGHHKAAAAALEGRKLNTLVILPMTGLSYPVKERKQPAKLGIGGEWTDLNELGIGFEAAKQLLSGRRLDEKSTARCLALKNNNFDEYDWPQALLNTARQYPTATTLAHILWAEDLSDERLARVLSGQEFPDESQMFYLCSALYHTNSPHFCETAFHVGKNDCYARIWSAVFRLLVNVHSGEVEDFFVDFLVNDDGTRPDASEIAASYWSDSSAHT